MNTCTRNLTCTEPISTSSHFGYCSFECVVCKTLIEMFDPKIRPNIVARFSTIMKHWAYLNFRSMRCFEIDWSDWTPCSTIVLRNDALYIAQFNNTYIFFISSWEKFGKSYHQCVFLLLFPGPFQIICYEPAADQTRDLSHLWRTVI